MNNSYHLQTTNLNFWELASIMCTPLGFPGIVWGWYIAKKYGTHYAMGSICVGNLILWLLGLAIISMSAGDRTHAIENIKRQLGKTSAIFAALCLMISIMTWYIFQLKSTSFVLDRFFQINTIQENLSIRCCAALGFLGALLGIGGIRIIKWLNVICFPLLIIYYFYALGTSSHLIDFSNWKLSFPAVSTVVLYLLSGIVYCPTFFRHSRSRADSYLALTLMVIFFTFFQISSICIGFENSSLPLFTDFVKSNFLLQIMMVLFVILFSSCSALVDIYFASTSLEALMPRFEGPKEYAIVGLAGTAAYTFLQISPPMKFLGNLTNAFIASLGIVLLITFLDQNIIRSRNKTSRKFLGKTSLLVGCLASIFLEMHNPHQQNQTLLVAMGVCALFILCTIFIEETIWSIKNLQISKRIKK